MEVIQLIIDFYWTTLEKVGFWKTILIFALILFATGGVIKLIIDIFTLIYLVIDTFLISPEKYPKDTEEDESYSYEPPTPLTPEQEAENKRVYEETLKKVKADPTYQAFLEKYKKPTTLLHPTPAEISQPQTASKIGGHPYMDTFSAWPGCEICNKPLVYYMQLWQKDVPQAEFPSNKDIMYVFGCLETDCQKDDDHIGFEVFFKNSKELCSNSIQKPNHPYTDAPTFGKSTEKGKWLYGHYKEIECAFHPKKEYDYPSDWTTSIREDLLPSPIFEDINDLYWEVTPTKDNTKVGGYIMSIQGFEGHRCKTCNEIMEFFFQLTSEEGFNKGNGIYPHNIPMGDAGNLYVYLCRKCDDNPTWLHFDCF